MFNINIFASPGILVGMPDAFYRRKMLEETGKVLGPQDSYGSGMKN
jgi:hypothetical protein